MITEHNRRLFCAEGEHNRHYFYAEGDEVVMRNREGWRMGERGTYRINRSFHQTSAYCTWMVSRSLVEATSRGGSAFARLPASHLLNSTGTTLT